MFVVRIGQATNRYQMNLGKKETRSPGGRDVEWDSAQKLYESIPITGASRNRVQAPLSPNLSPALLQATYSTVTLTLFLSTPTLTLDLSPPLITI
jgi:hypothetical protein